MSPPPSHQVLRENQWPSDISPAPGCKDCREASQGHPGPPASVCLRLLGRTELTEAPAWLHLAAPGQGWIWRPLLALSRWLCLTCSGSLACWADRHLTRGQDDRPDGISTCNVRSECHLISEQVSLGYQMSLQFALAPLGGSFLKQRDRLRGGRSRQRGVERQEADRERETDTDVKHRAHRTEQSAPPQGKASAARELKGAAQVVWRG